MRQANRRWQMGLVVGAVVVGFGVPLAVAQTDVINVLNDNVGIGVSTPGSILDVRGPSAAVQVSGSATNQDLRLVFYDNYSTLKGRLLYAGANSTGNKAFGFINDSADFLYFYGVLNAPIIFYTNSTERFRISGSGYLGVGVTNPLYPLQMASGAYCTAGGVWTNASSRAYKQDIQDLSTEAAEETLENLTPVTYAYKVAPEEHHVGFIAEDVPDLVATPDRKGLSSMDVVAVLTKVVQDQKGMLEEQQKAIAELRQEVAQLKRQK